MSDAGTRQPRPAELLAGIDLAARGHVGVGEHMVRRDAVAADDVEAERFDRRHLRLGEIGIAAVMPKIVDLDPDGAGIDVRAALPMGDARVPGAGCLGHHLGDGAIFAHHVMA